MLLDSSTAHKTKILLCPKTRMHLHSQIHSLGAMQHISCCATEMRFSGHCDGCTALQTGQYQLQTAASRLLSSTGSKVDDSIFSILKEKYLGCPYSSEMVAKAKYQPMNEFPALSGVNGGVSKVCQEMA
jgi:hypothetical protein